MSYETRHNFKKLGCSVGSEALSLFGPIKIRFSVANRENPPEWSALSVILLTAQDTRTTRLNGFVDFPVPAANRDPDHSFLPEHNTVRLGGG